MKPMTTTASILFLFAGSAKLIIIIIVIGSLSLKTQNRSH